MKPSHHLSHNVGHYALEMKPCFKVSFTFTAKLNNFYIYGVCACPRAIACVCPHVCFIGVEWEHYTHKIEIRLIKL